jgi:hypothetical protein
MIAAVYYWITHILCDCRSDRIGREAAGRSLDTKIGILGHQERACWLSTISVVCCVSRGEKHRYERRKRVAVAVRRMDKLTAVFLVTIHGAKRVTILDLLLVN